MIDSTLTGLESHQFQHHSSWAFLTCEALKRLHCQVNMNYQVDASEGLPAIWGLLNVDFSCSET